MIKKFHQLIQGDKAKHGDEILTFEKIDGCYAHWRNEKGELQIGNAIEYELKDGIFYPVNK